jgi:FkbM family methyltransferase
MPGSGTTPAPTKTVRVNAVKRRVQGISATDPYFVAVTDDFEDHFPRFCRRYVGRDYVCLDIGANIGMTTFAISDCCPDGRVIAVEPNRLGYAALEANIADNGLKNVTPFRSVVGSTKGTIGFAENSAFGHVAGNGIETPITTIEGLMTQFELPRLDLVKVDVEGFEPIILRHSIDTLKRHGTLVFLEFNSWCLLAYSRTDPVSFLQWLFDNFTHIHVVSRNERMILERIEKSQLLPFLHDNLVNQGCVSDLVVTNDPARLQIKPSQIDYKALSLAEQVETLRNENSELVRRQEKLESERDELARRLAQRPFWRRI